MTSKPIQHGTPGGYTNRNCRCLECRAANAAYVRKRRQERRRMVEADPSVVPHGLASTHDNWLCRCDECRQAHNEAERTRIRKRDGAK